MATADGSWWRHGAGYQIYPLTFQDSNGDGIGDLPGITGRLPYLQRLGVDVLWLSPITPSPMADAGYDVADHCDVDPRLGTMADVDELLAAAHQRGMRVILDIVPNHTSDQHPWFRESRASRSSPRRDWYVWRPGRANGQPPNNWLSIFGGPTWTFDEASGEWYLHSFLPEQPELNWRNPAVAAAMEEVMRFWLRRGVDGFRIDVVYRLLKHPQLLDNPWLPGVDRAIGYRAQDHVHDRDQPEVHEVVRGFRRLADGFGDRLLLGETTILDPVRVARYYGNGADELHLAFNFAFAYQPWERDVAASAVDAQEAALPPGCQPSWVLSNHDVPRHPDRFGPDASRAAAVLLLTLRGTPFLYQGEELGMEGAPVPETAVRDCVGRDPERAPMRWDRSPNAGFCPDGATPWLPVARAPVAANVADQERSSDSLLWWYRRLLAVRRAVPALHGGAYRRLPAPEGVLLFERQAAGSTARIAIGFADATGQRVDLAGLTPILATDDGARRGLVDANAAVVAVDPAGAIACEETLAVR